VRAPPTDFRALIEALTDKRVDFVIVGGIALVLQGAPRTTIDLDICYARTPENLSRLADSLAPLSPTLRGAPPGLPFSIDARTLASGLNFTLDTTRGELDLLGEVTGVGGYSAVAEDAVEMELYGHRVRVMSLASLERAKRAAGRLKDLADLAHIAELRRRGQ
jgi:predicted nucleotidyltransferase